MSASKIYVIIPFFNRTENLPHLYERLEAQTYQNFELVLIDHGTRNADPAEMPPFVRHLRGTPYHWWSGAINLGLRYILEERQAGDDAFVLLQNDDVSFGPRFLEDLLAAHRRFNAVVSAITLERGSGRIIDAQNYLRKWKALHECPLRGRNVSEITGDFLESDVLKGRGVLYPVSVVRKIGYVDERLHYRADPEWSFRAKRRGYRLGVVPAVSVETVIDTQVSLRETPTVAGLRQALFSPRSPGNLYFTWLYFRLCFGPLHALYAAGLSLARMMLKFAVYRTRGPKKRTA